MKHIFNISAAVTGYTKVFGIFGKPISHSLSPQMHLAAFQSLGLPCIYLPFEVDPRHLKKAVGSVVPLGLQGLNITIPHKQSVLGLLDELDPAAAKIGAVNTIEIRSGRLIGHNTDGKGYLASLYENNIDPGGMPVILVGAGGAARGVAVTLLFAGVSDMTIMARNLKKGEALAGDLGALSPKSKVSAVSIEKVQTISKDGPLLLINTTPLGMDEKDPFPFPPSQIGPGWIVSDLIYDPYETPLLLAAKKIGARTIPGLGMLLHQGVLAFEIWTKEKPPVDVMRKTLLKALTTLKN
ncbi:MAG: shikimate dehydrogenase [Nitrospiria bacterium]